MDEIEHEEQPQEATKDESKKSSTKHQNKLLYKQIREQMEFYFSDSNLSKDRFIKQETHKSEDGFIDLSLFLKFNKIRTLTSDLNMIVKSLKRSTVLELNEEQTKVKRCIPFVEPNQEDVDKRTVYVERLPPHVTHSILKSIFSRCGPVAYISLPTYKTTKQIKGFAFVEFETKEGAKNAIKMLNDPEESVDDSVGKFPRGNREYIKLEEKLRETVGVESAIEEESEQSNENKKRKLAKVNDSVESVTTVEPVSKERKVESETENGDEAVKAKKKNRRRKHSVIKAKKLARKLEIAEEATLLHLRVIPKTQWLQLKQDYLNRQKQNMSELKAKLREIKEKDELERIEKRKTAKRQSTGETKMEVITAVKLPDVDNGSVIKLTPKNMSDESTYELFKLTRQQFKNEKLSEFADQIAYVDLDKNTNKIFVRCKDRSTAETLVQRSSEFLNEFNKNLLTGSEEAVYFSKIASNRDKKAVKKEKKELRGKCKVINRANKILQDEVIETKTSGLVNQARVHVKFDD